MAKVITFGEIMLRLSPESFMRFVQAERFCATYSGAEANVAVSMANFGVDTAFVTKIPQNEIGKSAENYLRRFGVNTDYICHGGNRLGIYFLEKGASQRPSKVIYDRAGSSISAAESSDFNWEEIFKGVEIFHVTGITPALSDSMSKICIEACRIAKQKGITVSCDLNYRKKLWTSEQAKKVMTELCQYVDICVANEEDANTVFGIKASETDIESGKLNKEGYVQVAKQLAEQFHFKKVAITLRESISASVNNWSGLLYTENQAYFSKKYEIHIVDRVGAGDSFTAGLLYSELLNKTPAETIEFAVAASCLKHSVEGDFNMVTVDEVMSLVNGNSSGRVQR